MRLIDADKFEAILSSAITIQKSTAIFLSVEEDEFVQMEMKAYRDIYNGIKKEPTIDAVPIIRCRDCKLRECEGQSEMIVCGKDGFSHPADWFCADGERRDADG